MAFRALGDVAIENLSESEKDFCVRMAKEMVRVSAGEFMMGALEDDEEAWDNERPRHKVTLTRDFLMGKYAVTQALWDSVMGSNPSDFEGANRPVENVSWFEVVEFCNKLSKREGLESAYTINGENVTCNWSAKGYRLPTEAEWEYSAGSGQRFKYSGSDNVDEVAWYDDNSDTGNGHETHPVGQKKSNGFGIYDMSGNVDEWAWDRFGDYSSGSQTDPTGPDSGP
jgi:formylglycine-generating enzyme required for sulfatase activity